MPAIVVERHEPDETTANVVEYHGLRIDSYAIRYCVCPYSPLVILLPALFCFSDESVPVFFDEWSLPDIYWFNPRTS